MNKIREKVNADRYYVKLCKRSFLLVDLFENTGFGQLFNNEQMKFSFQKNQTLTTFAYEVSKTYQYKTKRFHFIHVAKPDSQGQIGYHSFPRLIHFNE